MLLLLLLLGRPGWSPGMRLVFSRLFVSDGSQLCDGHRGELSDCAVSV